MPKNFIEEWKLELEHTDKESSKIELYKRVEKYLDKGYGRCYLQNRSVAEMVQNSLLHFDRNRYKLISWVIMPNHIHLLLKPKKNHALSDIVHSIKSFTAQKANKILNRKGKFWQEDYFDRYIRDYDHYMSAIKYIEQNPVKAGLCKSKSDWRFSSAYNRSE